MNINPNVALAGLEEHERYYFDPKKVLNTPKKYKYDDKWIMAIHEKGRLGIEFDRDRLEKRIIKVKDVLPLAEQKHTQPDTVGGDQPTD